MTKITKEITVTCDMGYFDLGSKIELVTKCFEEEALMRAAGFNPEDLVDESEEEEEAFIDAVLELYDKCEVRLVLRTKERLDAIDFITKNTYQVTYDKEII